MHTPFWDQVADAERRDGLFAEMCDKLPTARMTTADDVAQMIHAAMDNRALNGSVLYVDSGQRLV